jgi:hypothetical protein
MALRDQPAYVIKMRAKPGLGDKLFALATEGMEKSGSSDRFIIAREEIIGLLAEPPMGIEVHPYSALPADLA